MRLFHVHPSDSQWLRRWLRAQVVCCVTILCVLVSIRVETVDHSHLSSTNRPITTAAVFGQISSPISVPPEGWRRTSEGWEHVSTWRTIDPRSLDEIIQGQLNTEPAWAQRLFETLRNVPPLMFAVLQITLIALIVHVFREQTELLNKSP